MNDLRFHHVGVGVTELEPAIETYLALGYTLQTQVDDPGLRVRIALLQRPDHPLIELVAPLGDDHPLKSFIRRRQLPSPYHTCYAVSSLNEAVHALREQGFMPVGEAAHAVAFDAPIQYLYHRSIGLLELVELVELEPA